jgi:hypothetical protein
MKGLRAKDESRTRDLNLGKVALYQLSYFRLYFQFFLVSNSDQNPPAGECELNRLLNLVCYFAIGLQI